MQQLAARAYWLLNRRRCFRPNAACITGEPSAQAAIEAGGKWHSRFPQMSGIETGGYATLFEDGRVKWAIERLGGIAGASILELGPLEGGHTYMLDRAGAGNIVCVEALKTAYMKCLITKEVLNIKSANFLLGDCVSYLQSTTTRFDLIWASGILYHMTEPLRLLELISSRTDRLFLWTHFFDDGAVPAYVRRRKVSFRGASATQFERPYFRLGRAGYCGGAYSGRAWLQRSDILGALARLGFDSIEIGGEDRTNPQGPSFSLLARRML